jgi:nitroimidazol reductase NimA-like FMN-containing flavoprotein (pyridoxamine 5'-phosphate oxidase superfamily)
MGKSSEDATATTTTTSSASLAGEAVTPTVQHQHEYSQTELNTVRSYKRRATYDHEAVADIFAQSPIAHAAFVDPELERVVNFPLCAVIGPAPSSADRDGDDEDGGDAMLYLHTRPTSRLAVAAKQGEGVRVCVTTTHSLFILSSSSREYNADGCFLFPSFALKTVDGLVMAPRPNGHSLNYRSATVHGLASVLSDMDSKKAVMTLVTDTMAGYARTAAVRPFSPPALRSVTVLKVAIESASAKTRTGPTGETVSEDEDEEEPVWTGVVPCWTQFGEPVTENGGSGPRLADVRNMVQRKNDRGREYAQWAATSRA